MFIHQFIVYLESGISLAQYPKIPRLDYTTSFFTALRSFSLANKYGDVQQIRWMNRKATFIYNRISEITFAMITDPDDDDDIATKFLSHVRDEMIPRLPKNLSTLMVKEGCRDEMLEEIVDATIASFNETSTNEMIYI